MPAIGLVRLLGMLQNGKLDLDLGGRTLAHVDSENKSVALDVDGLDAGGVPLSRLVRLEGVGSSRLSMFEGAEHIARSLAEAGWTVSILSGGDPIATLGKNVSRLEGHVRISPFKIRALLKDLRD